MSYYDESNNTEKMLQILASGPMSSDELADRMGMIRREPTTEFKELLFNALYEGKITLNVNQSLSVRTANTSKENIEPPSGCNDLLIDGRYGA